MPPGEPQPLIPKHGGYRNLKSFEVARLVYDVTVRFCDRYVDCGSRTHDQMVQAARSGVQNIAEGSQASGTSKKMEIKLTNVARSSLEELRLDYEDFLRHRRLTEWDWDDPRRAELIRRRPETADQVARWAEAMHEAERAQEKNGRHGPHGQNEPEGPEQEGGAGSTSSISSTASIPKPGARPATYPEIAANGALALIAVATSLLRRQIGAQGDAFEAEGGFTERLYRTRRAHRDRPDNR